MKILMFTPYFHPDTGGCISRVDALAKYFKKLGHEPVVVIPYVKKFNYSKLGYKVIAEKLFSSKKELFSLINSMNKIREIIKNEKPDVIYTTTPPDYLSFAVAKAIKNEKMILDVRDPWVEGLKSESANKIKVKIGEWMEGYICKKASAIVAVTPLIKDILKRRYKIPEEKISVLYNGIDLELVKGVKPIKKPKDKKVFLYMGVFGGAQDLPIFLKKFIPVLRDDFKVILIGDGKEEETLKKMAYNSDKIEVIPRMSKSEVMKWVKMCDYGLVVLANKPELKYAIPSKIFEIGRAHV